MSNFRYGVLLEVQFLMSSGLAYDAAWAEVIKKYNLNFEEIFLSKLAEQREWMAEVKKMHK